MTNKSTKIQRALDVLEENKKDQDIIREFFKHAHGLEVLDPLIDKGWFAPSALPDVYITKDGNSYVTPFWHQIEYLIKASKEIGKTCDKEASGKILQILRDATRGSSPDAKKNYHVWNGFVEILCNLPVDYIEQPDVKQIGDWLSWDDFSAFSTSALIPGLVTNLLRSGTSKSLGLLLCLLSQLTLFKELDETVRENSGGDYPEFIIEKYWINELFEERQEEIGEIWGKPVIKLLCERLSEWSSKKCNPQPSYWWRPAVEDHEQNKIHRSETANILVTAIRGVADAHMRNNSSITQEVVNYFIDQKYSIFHRLAIYFANIKFTRENDDIWKIPLKELFSSELTHEFYHYLKNNFKHLSDQKKQEVFDYVAAIKLEYDVEKDKSKIEEWEKLRWLSAIINQKFDPADELYEKIKSKVGGEHENPDFLVYFSSGWKGDVSPIDEAEISSMSIQNLVKYLLDFKPTGGWDAPTTQGLKDTLKSVCQADPLRYSSSINKFTNCYPIYWNAILNGLKEAWADKTVQKRFEWIPVLNFIEEKFQVNKEWYSKELGVGVYENWENQGFLISVMGLLKSVLSDDKNPIPRELLPRVKKTILLALEFSEMGLPNDMRDYLSSAINKPRGYVIDALLSYSLHTARIARNEEDGIPKAWNDVEDIFDNELLKCENTNFEFSAIISSRIGNMVFLSKDWLFNNANKLFDQQNEINWQAALSGYSYVGTGYWSFDETLVQLGVYDKVLASDHEHDRIRDSFLERITLGYLFGKQLLSGRDSVFANLMEVFRFYDISLIIRFMWTFRKNEHDREKSQKQIFLFWEECLRKINDDDDDDEQKKLLSDLNQLATYITILDEKRTGWLLRSAKYVEKNYHSMWLIKSLLRLANDYPENVALVYLSMLENTQPTYPEEDILAIFDKLCEKNKLVEAKEIYSIYKRKIGWNKLDELELKYLS